ncbi:hypothetical protein JXB01_04800 [Candidatus Micrarchaeota archaeon]|nr:hypothetical protein [Candidatus Micrarchaeota archaeon]
MILMDIMGKFKESVNLVNPNSYEKTINKWKSKGTFGEAVFMVVVALLITSLISYIAVLASASLVSESYGLGIAELGLILPLVILVLGVIGFVIGQYIYLFVAKAFGGKGKIGPQSHLMALIQMFIAPVGVILSFVPCLGSIATLVLSIWSLFLAFKILKAVHSISTGKAIATIIVSWIINMIIIAVPVILLVLYLMPASITTTAPLPVY